MMQTIETYENGVVVATREVDIPPEQVNRDTIQDQATQALTANRTFLAIATPTAAQNAAQAKALTRQMNGVLRLVLGKVDGTD